MTIFLSYSSRNQDQIARLAEILRNFDKDVFVEQKSLGGSISWEQAFSKIKNCDLFTIALTQYSLNSAARKLEMEYAAALKKPILVILLEDVGALPPELNAAATVQFRENYEPSLTVFSDAIRQVLPPAEAMTEATPPDWSTALADAQQRLQTASMPLYEQRRLAVSLRDLLERRESFAPTLALIKQKMHSRTSDVQLIEEFGYLLEDAQQKARWRVPLRLLLIALPLLIIGGIAAVLLPRLQSSAGAQETPTSVSIAVTATLTETMVIAGADTEVPTEAITATPSYTPTITLTPTDTPIPPTVTLVQAFFPTRSRTPTPSAEAAQMVSETPAPTNTPSVMPTETTPPTEAASATTMMTATDLPTDESAVVPTETATATLTATETLTETPEPTATETATATTVPSETPLPTSTPSLTFTPLPTETLTAIPTDTATATATETATFTPSPLPTETPTATQTASATATFTETPLPTITLTPTLPTSIYIGLRVTDSEAGVRVTEVGASAQLSGVRIDDVVEAVDDVPVATAMEFANEMNARRPVEVVTLRLRRGTGLVFATISLGITDFAAPTATPAITASATATP